MPQQLSLVSLVVRDYDEAIAWYTRVLGFTLLEDTALGEGRRWVRVAPPGSAAGLLLAQASTPEQVTRIGNQTGGRVFLFLDTEDCRADCDRLRTRGVTLLRGPVDEPYGTVAVFADLYGNQWDLVERPRTA